MAGKQRNIQTFALLTDSLTLNCNKVKGPFYNQTYYSISFATTEYTEHNNLSFPMIKQSPIFSTVMYTLQDNDIYLRLKRQYAWK